MEALRLMGPVEETVFEPNSRNSQIRKNEEVKFPKNFRDDQTPFVLSSTAQLFAVQTEVEDTRWLESDSGHSYRTHTQPDVHSIGEFSDKSAVKTMTSMSVPVQATAQDSERVLLVTTRIIAENSALQLSALSAALHKASTLLSIGTGIEDASQRTLYKLWWK